MTLKPPQKTVPGILLPKSTTSQVKLSCAPGLFSFSCFLHLFFLHLQKKQFAFCWWVFRHQNWMTICASQQFNSLQSFSPICGLNIEHIKNNETTIYSFWSKANGSFLNFLRGWIVFSKHESRIKDAKLSKLISARRASVGCGPWVVLCERCCFTAEGCLNQRLQGHTNHSWSPSDLVMSAAISVHGLFQSNCTAPGIGGGAGNGFFPLPLRTGDLDGVRGLRATGRDAAAGSSSTTTSS